MATSYVFTSRRSVSCIISVSHVDSVITAWQYVILYNYNIVLIVWRVYNIVLIVW